MTPRTVTFSLSANLTVSEATDLATEMKPDLILIKTIFDNATDGILLADPENQKFYFVHLTIPILFSRQETLLSLNVFKRLEIIAFS